jgi:glycine cleavage system H protein
MSETPAGDTLVFMMGQFAARIPTDRRYARNHMWALPVVGGYRFGFTAYAIRLLQDVYFLAWSVDAGTQLRERQAIGEIESSKAESELYAPMAGTLSEFNQELLADPSGINVDGFGAGWLFTMQGPGEALLSPQQYLVHLGESWKIAEKTIKGQINQSDE